MICIIQRFNIKINKVKNMLGEKTKGFLAPSNNKGSEIKWIG